MRLVGNVIFISVVIAISSVIGFACDCLTRSSTESFGEADVVFIGEVTSVDRSASTTTFEVQRWFKGRKTPKVVVFDTGLTDCDMWFHPESTYIVFAREFNGRLIAPSCYATKAIGPPRYELRARAWQSAATPSRSYGEIALVTLTSVAISLGLGVLVGTLRNRLK